MSANVYPSLSYSIFREHQKNGAYIIDLRSTTDFMAGFIPGSIFGGHPIALDALPYCLPEGAQLLLVQHTDIKSAAGNFLEKKGFTILGSLDGGFITWVQNTQELDMIIDIEADELIMDMPHDPKLTIIDIRNEFSFEEMHLKNSINLPLEDMSDIAEIANYSDDNNIYFISEDGINCLTAASLFKRHGLHNVRIVVDGWDTIASLPNAPVIKNKSKLN